MKLFVNIMAAIWLMCGAIGAWWVGDLNVHHLDKVALGPITLAKSINDDPVTYPGPS
jgi:hypothetical protein